MSQPHPLAFTDEQTEVQGGEVGAQVNSWLREGPESKLGQSIQELWVALGFLHLDLAYLTHGGTHMQALTR